MSKNFWKNKRVLITGHTGFKGGWLALWLHKMGANLHGYSLELNPSNIFYRKVFSENFPGDETFENIKNYSKIFDTMKYFKPEIIFHLAAQPLVKESYVTPYETFCVNIIGLTNILEAVRVLNSTRVIVNITTDKVYENQEWQWPYREIDRLGGNDPYSASKTCSEIITASYKKSFLQSAGVQISTARAGNVIGGGDASPDRLVPDYFRSHFAHRSVKIRSPQSTRPWQHVLDPLSGYLKLAEKLYSDDTGIYASPWNFGPTEDPITVEALANKLVSITNGKAITIEPNPDFTEHQSLVLDSSKARKMLGWRPKLDIETALTMTYHWAKNSIEGEDMKLFSEKQISNYKQLKYK